MIYSNLNNALTAIRRCPETTKHLNKHRKKVSETWNHPTKEAIKMARNGSIKPSKGLNRVEHARNYSAHRYIDKTPSVTINGIKFSSPWSATRGFLEQLLGTKCWYCERSFDSQELQVDHFRPKKGVSENKHHPGYWWLTYSAKNYRLSCKRCNELKSTQFKLHNEAVRCRIPGDESLETAMFLDPSNIGDSNALSWLYTGEAQSYEKPQNIAERKINYTINAIGLNRRPNLKKKRQEGLGNLRRLLKDGVRASNALTIDSKSKKKEFVRVIGQIRKQLESTAEFCACNRDELNRLVETTRYGNFPWIKRLANEYGDHI